MDEFELKFQVPRERVAAVEEALRRGSVQSTRLRARYFDTADGALARARLGLRLRQEGGSWVQTAKGPGDGTFHRLEHSVELPEGDAGMPDVRRHSGHAVGRKLQRALERSGQPLQPTFETDVERLTRIVESPGVTVEVALDRGEVRAGGRAQPLQELEFELKQGHRSALVELAQTWRAQHLLWLDPLPKAEIGRRLAAGEDAGPATRAAPVVGSGKRASRMLAAVLESALDQVLANAREIAAGTGQPAHVHQARVGLRRLRTALRELADVPALGSLPPQVAPALTAAFRVLGEHRDRSTLIPALQAESAAAGGPQLHWRPALPDVAAAVREPAFQEALLHLLGLAQGLKEGAGDGSDDRTRPLRARARKRLARLHARIARDGVRFEQLDEEGRHRVRKRLKRLRYLAELMRPLFKPGAVDSYVKALKQLQDALGAYQDANAGRRMFVQQAAQEPAAWFVAGYLAAREEALAGTCARACRKMLRKARPFWD